MKFSSRFSFFLWITSCSHICWKKTCYLPTELLCTFVKIKWSYLANTMFHYYTFLTSLNTGQWDSYNSVLIFQNCFRYSSFFALLYNFRFSLSISEFSLLVYVNTVDFCLYLISYSLTKLISVHQEFLKEFHELAEKDVPRKETREVFVQRNSGSQQQSLTEFCQKQKVGNLQRHRIV